MLRDTLLKVRLSWESLEYRYLLHEAINHKLGNPNEDIFIPLVVQDMDYYGRILWPLERSNSVAFVEFIVEDQTLPTTQGDDWFARGNYFVALQCTDGIWDLCNKQVTLVIPFDPYNSGKVQSFDDLTSIQRLMAFGC